MVAPRTLPLLALVLIAGAAHAQSPSAQKATPDTKPLPTLRVGEKAPAMKVAKWVKGTPTAGFEPGKVYVVEFWATWCPPCRTSIPHLTELQKKYGERVSFNGIAVYQREPKDEYVASVEKFVTAMGPKMDYAVAVDTEPKNGAMAVNWMTAAGQGGIPTAFVVGKDGRVAYIGHPMDPALPTTLDKILDGTFDARTARTDAEAAAAKEKAVADANARVLTAYKAKDEAAGDAAFAELVAKYPEYEGYTLAARFERRLETGRAAEGITLLRAGWDGKITDPETLNNLAWTLATDERIKKPDYSLAVALARRGVEITKERNAPVMDTLAYALFKAGNTDDAIAWQTKAVKLTDGKDDEMNAALAKYKRAKGS